MFWQKRTPPLSPSDLRRIDWDSLAHRLELQEMHWRERSLRELLNLSSNTPFSPVLALPLGTGEGDLLFYFDYIEIRSGPAGSVRQTVSTCLLSLHAPIAPLSLKVQRKLIPLLESLAASGIGGQRVEVVEDALFNERISVFARDPDAARALLREPVRRILSRALEQPNLNPTFLLGEQHLLLLNKAPEAKPTPLEVLEGFSADLMSLYAALTSPPQADVTAES